MAEDTSTQVMDDVQAVDGPSEQELLDAVMANSPIMEEVGIPLPEEEVHDDGADESVDEDPEAEEAVEEDDEEEVEEVEEEEVEEDADDESATQGDTYTTDDLDLDAKLVVKVDGEEMEVSFGDLVKGYQTDAHLSKKGRELGEAQKALEEERVAKVEEASKLAEASASMLMGAEQSYAKEYHEIESQIEKARDNGDTYEVNELKDKREQIQKKYWGARKNREKMMADVEAKKQEIANEAWNQQIHYFNERIPELIPDFNEEVAGEIRQFALDEGIDPDILDQITDPVIVKFVDDYRRLKQNVNKGAAKRKVTPTKKAVPTKKAKPAAKKKEDADKMTKARAFREDASPEDHMAFLRQHASKTLKL